MLEIYNEQINDLLNLSNNHLDIKHDSDGNIHVPGLTQVVVSNLQDVLEVFGRGSANRATSTTNLNEYSSRSHLILNVIVTTNYTNNISIGTKAKLYLVDLAGSEKVSKSGVTGTAMKEAQHINKSLASLGDVLEALDQKSKHIPYR